MGSCKRSNQVGFTYLGLLLIMAIMGITMTATAELWQSVMQHEREKELIFIGHQIRDAIGRYYKSDMGNGGYPTKLEDLLQDPNSEEVARYLRKLYPDPITGSTQWGLVQDEDGAIKGVFSLSSAKPFKLAGFDKIDFCFTNKQRYSDWKFTYDPDWKQDDDVSLDQCEPQ